MTLAAVYGFTPRDVDALTLRDGMVMLLGAKDRRRHELQHTGAIMDGLLNYGGMRGEGFQPVPIGFHFRLMAGIKDPTTPAESGEEVIAGLKELHPEWFETAEA